MDTPKQAIQELAARRPQYTDSMAIRQCRVWEERNCYAGDQIREDRREDNFPSFLHIQIGSIIELRPGA